MCSGLTRGSAAGYTYVALNLCDLKVANIVSRCPDHVCAWLCGNHPLIRWTQAKKLKISQREQCNFGEVLVRDLGVSLVWLGSQICCPSCRYAGPQY